MRTLAVSLLMTLSSLGLAQADPDGSFDLVHVMPFGQPSAVAAVGDIGIYGITNGVMIVDVSDPASPVRLSRLSVPGTVKKLTVESDRLFIAAGEAGVAVASVADLNEPKLLRVIDTPVEAVDVEVVGDWVFIVDAGGDFYSANLDPGVTTGSTLEVPGARAVAVDGALAVVAGSAGVSVIDISDPENMVVRAAIPIESRCVTIDGDITYLGTYDQGLVVCDLADPANPVQIGGYSLPTWVRDLEYSEGHVWLYGGELRVFDVTNPAAPDQVGNLYFGYAYNEIAVAGDKVLLGPKFQSPVVDVSDPAHPEQAGEVITSTYLTDLTRRGDLAFAALGTAGWDYGWVTAIAIIDISDPTDPVDLAVLVPGSGSAYVAMAVDGTTIALVDSAFVVELYDLSTPSEPVLLATHPMSESVEGAALSQRILYLSMAPGLRAFDVSDPSVLVELGSFEPSWYMYSPLRSRVVGNYLYGDYSYWAFESWSGGLLVVDASKPGELSEVEPLGIGYPSEFMILGDRAYVVGLSGFSGRTDALLIVLDIASPGSPSVVDTGWVGSSCGGGQSTAVSVIGKRVIVAFDGYLMEKRMSRLGDIPLIDIGHTWVVGMTTVGDHLVVADDAKGLMTFFNNEVFVDDFETADLSAW